MTCIKKKMKTWILYVWYFWHQIKMKSLGISYRLWRDSLANLSTEREFVLSLQPDEGPDFGKVEHIPCVEFWYRTHGQQYYGYDLGHSELLEGLKH